MSGPAGLLPGNLFPVADSDFETSLTGNWAATTNCTLSRDTATGFTGAASLKASATAAGAVTITYAPVPVTAGDGYVLSWYVKATAAGRSAHASVVFKNSGGSQVGSTLALTTYSLTNSVWVPAADSFAAPATAVTATISVTTSALGSSEPIIFDTFYAAQSVVQVLAAWGTSPLAAPQWYDMTPFTRADQGISYSRGRQDETSTVQPGSAQFTLDNSASWAGWFAQGNTAGPFTGIAPGRRVRLNFADETGAWHTRWDGFVTDDPTTWQGGPGLESVTTFSCQDILAWLGRSNQLRTMLEEEMLLDSPQCLYVLADPQGSATGSDSSGNTAPPLTRKAYGSGGAMAFGSSSAGIIGAGAPGYASSPLQSASFTPGASAASDVQLEAALSPPVSAAAGFSFEIWYSETSGAMDGVPISVGNSRTGQVLAVSTAAGTNNSFLAFTTISSGIGSSAQFTLGAEAGQLFVTVSGTTAIAYVDGIQVASLTIPAGFTANRLTVGGPMGGPQWPLLAWNGSLNCAAVYPSVLSTGISGRITAHYTAGWQQNWSELISQLVTNILNYAGIPAGFQSMPSPGVSYADAYEITGQTPLSVLQLYQQVDGGVLYVNAAGQVAWQDRTARYAAQVTPALVLQAGQYEPDYSSGATTQYLVNDATYGGSVNLPGGVRAINAASKLDNGTYPQGDPLSPVTGPWYTYPYQLPSGSPTTTAPPPDSDILADAVNWTTGVYGTPAPRSPNLTIELGSQAAGPAVAASLISRAAAYGADVGSVVELAVVPASAPAGTRASFLMVEGLKESFKRTGDPSNPVDWTLQFNTSPGMASAAWIAGDANMGVLDLTAVVGRGTDGASQSGIEYAGPPYPVPAFSSTMNLTGSVGANDMRGLAANVQQAITPPMFYAQQVTTAQSVPNIASTDVKWDTLQYDTSGGFALATSVTTWQCMVPGNYLLMAVVCFPANGTGAREAWFQHNGTQVDQNAQTGGFTGFSNCLYIEAQVGLQLGDLVKVTCWQGSGGALVLNTGNGGCQFQGLFQGT